MFHVWLEHFPSDFDEPDYTTLLKIKSFVTSEMRASHGEELAKKIQQRLDKFRITPFEDEGENLDICVLVRVWEMWEIVKIYGKLKPKFHNKGYTPPFLLKIVRKIVISILLLLMNDGHFCKHDYDNKFNFSQIFIGYCLPSIGRQTHR